MGTKSRRSTRATLKYVAFVGLATMLFFSYHLSRMVHRDEATRWELAETALAEASLAQEASHAWQRRAQEAEVALAALRESPTAAPAAVAPAASLADLQPELQPFRLAEARKKKP